MALRNENYEEAASVRDEITKLKERKAEGTPSDIPMIHAADIQALIEEKNRYSSWPFTRRRTI